jgi:hypothetical protein
MSVSARPAWKRVADQLGELLMTIESQEDAGVRGRSIFFCALLLCAGRRAAREATLTKLNLEEVLKMSTAGYEQAVRYLASKMEPPAGRQ